MELTDKDLHCMARHLQAQLVDDETFEQCVYCKYAVECSENAMDQFKKNKAFCYPFFDCLIPVIEKETGVVIRHIRRPDTDCLAGSWIEAYPELLNVVTRASFEERQDILHNPGILAYIRNPTTDNLRKLFPHQEDNT